MAILANASISFHTNNEDKDDDTHVTVEVRDFNNVVAARVDSNFGHFGDNGDAGPYGLSVVNASSRDDLQRGNVHIHIDPNGHDTWRFNFFLQLTFDDNSSLSGGANGLELTQDNRDVTLGLAGILH